MIAAPPDQADREFLAANRDESVSLRTDRVRLGLPGLTGFEDEDTKRLIEANRYLRKAGVPTLRPLLPLLFRLKGKPYRLHDYFPFEPLFRTRMPRRILFKTGRQVAKSRPMSARERVYAADGRPLKPDELRIGDRVLALGPDLRWTTQRIVGRHENPPEPIFRVTTRTGSEFTLTATHELRTLYGFTPLDEIGVGGRIAMLRRGGEFVGRPVARNRIVATAYLVGDGYCGRTYIELTSACPDVLAEYRTVVEAINGAAPRLRPSRSRASRIRVNGPSRLRDHLIEDGLLGKLAWEKRLPAWVFSLSRANTILFLSRLWATDGMLKARATRPDISYSTTSYDLSRDVRALLLKLGIPSSITRKPAGYRKDGVYHPCRDVYIVRVETRAGWQTFLDTIKIPGKPAFRLRDTVSNNNRDTIPLPVTTLLADLAATTKWGHADSLAMSGLRVTPKYPLGREKAAAYLDYFDRVAPDHPRLDELRNLVEGDVLWDEIVAIEPLGAEPTWDIEVDGDCYEDCNYVLDGAVSHNSTSLAAQGVLFSNSIPHFSTLYVMPLFETTRRFSHQYVRPFIDDSPFKHLFTNRSTTNSVLQRSFTNGSVMYFSYAFLDVERTRGYPADKNCLVEGSPVELADGRHLPIELVRADDHVVSADASGRIVADTVTETLYQGVQHAYEVTFSDGSVVRCTRDERFRRRDGSWVTLADLLHREAGQAAGGPGVNLLPGADAVGLFVRGLGHRTRQGHVRPAPLSGSCCRVATIARVVYLGLRRVWDLNTQVEHAFFVNGVLAHNCIDEVQNMHIDFIPMIHETLGGSRNWKLIQYAGTPKSLDNTIESLWTDSSQAEWCIKCHHAGCGEWNVPALTHDLLDMIGPHRADISPESPAVRCVGCGKPLDPRRPPSGWVHAHPDRRWTFAGYHVPQVIMPMHYEDPEAWDILLGKMQGRGNTTSTMFLNEVMGESCDSGSKMITVTELRRAASLPWRNEWREAERYARKRAYRFKVLAVDWGGGGGRVSGARRDSEKRLRTSFTSLAVLGLRPNAEVDVIWGHRSLRTHDMEYEARLCIEAITRFDCSHLVHDYGGAGAAREHLIVGAGFPFHQIIPVAYTPGARQKIMLCHPATEDHPRTWYSLDKTRSLALTCQCLKYGVMSTFEYDHRSSDDAGLLHDFLALQEEVIDSRLGTNAHVITRNPNLPDDFAQAVNIGACTLWHMSGHWPNLAEPARFTISEAVLRRLAPRVRVNWGDIN